MITQSIPLLVGTCASLILGIITNWIYDILKNWGLLPNRSMIKWAFLVTVAFLPLFVLSDYLAQSSNAPVSSALESHNIIQVEGNTNDNVIIQTHEGSNVVINPSTSHIPDHIPVPNLNNLTYDEARQHLVDAGWQPKMQHWSYSKDINVSFGNGLIFWERGYWEIDRCAGTGLANCRFEFMDVNGTLLVVGTIGQEIPKEGIHAIVNGWWFVNDHER